MNFKYLLDDILINFCFTRHWLIINMLGKSEIRVFKVIVIGDSGVGMDFFEKIVFALFWCNKI